MEHCLGEVEPIDIPSVAERIEEQRESFEACNASRKKTYSTGRPPGSSFPTNHHYPCLLVRQVDQFEELEKPGEYRSKTPAALCGR